ncbi:hypothetical protein RN001_009621 [Aquatica leii]|uniref:Uncharacterized protein n=1 Tax=Aquatica leii TaxID=1421715 RepID=A0AAN7Q2L6_9COLE|nr:hypothetical protein RN001_009621 [Aquatica leii]
MAPILYTFSASPAVRAVLITAEAIQLELDEVKVDLVKSEQLSESYSKVNPLQIVPSLDDNGNIICDSHVINGYLLDKYGKNASLYPKDIYQRCLVQQGMAFDLGKLYPVALDINLSYFRNEVTTLSPRTIETVNTLYKFLETMLKKQDWVALDHITLADISCYTTITTLNYHVMVKSTTYPKIANWMKRCSELPYFKNDVKNLESYYDVMKMFNVKRNED